jgi:hypothetical protein
MTNAIDTVNNNKFEPYDGEFSKREVYDGKIYIDGDVKQDMAYPILFIFFILLLYLLYLYSNGNKNLV